MVPPRMSTPFSAVLLSHIQMPTFRSHHHQVLHHFEELEDDDATETSPLEASFKVFVL